MAGVPRRVLGSSPRVRGTRRRQPDRAGARRFIPACAGNSRRRVFRAAYNVGSSPRVRGTPALDVIGHRCLTVHPRVCGELVSGLDHGTAYDGSSPRVRGTPPYPPPPYWRIDAVHPRVCGELAFAVAAPAGADGSSPRVRGTPRETRGTRRPRRFIPACAGNSERNTEQRLHGTVHPRVCGELHPRPQAMRRKAGSSPRVRGTRASAFVRQRDCRFIPACAGNSRLAGGLPRGWPVHPRVCGELWPWSLAVQSANGSSPRVRGTRRPPFRPLVEQRFIPACAGNSVVSSGSLLL